MQKVLYIDMDGVLVRFESAFPHLPAETLRKYEGREDEIPGIFALMDPMPGAVAAYEELRQLFDTYELSTAPWENPTAWSDKLLWAKRHLGPEVKKRLILSHHKNLNRGDFLVDNRTKNGVYHFEGEFIHFGSERFPDWPSLMERLRPRA